MKKLHNLTVDKTSPAMEVQIQVNLEKSDHDQKLQTIESVNVVLNPAVS